MLGQFIRSLRRSKGLTQAQIANTIGIKRQQIWYIERESACYSVDKLNKMGDAIGYNIEIHFIDQEDSRNISVYKVK